MSETKKKFIKKVEWVPSKRQSEVYEDSIECIYSNIENSKEEMGLDIGCNLGRHAVHMLPFFKKVIAFDPFIPDEFKQVSADHRPQLVVYEFALGSKEETRDFYFSSEEPSLSSFIEGFHESYNKVLSIPVKTLDSLGLKNISFIKLDVEGLEIDVLEGGRKTIVESQPIIYLEGAQKGKGEEYKTFFREINYQLISLSRAWVPIEQDEILNRDCLAYPEGKKIDVTRAAFLDYYDQHRQDYSRWIP